ncbi:hypothetical protein B0H10DRAFT_2444295 [Mycena sp. CBHHK59/15]|nr:hypothetical protein B0H10DRAFT_2444295 [Mycena sp. CBHHK59/15]
MSSSLSTAHFQANQVPNYGRTAPFQAPDVSLQMKALQKMLPLPANAQTIALKTASTTAAPGPAQSQGMQTPPQPALLRELLASHQMGSAFTSPTQAPSAHASALFFSATTASSDSVPTAVNLQDKTNYPDYSNSNTRPSAFPSPSPDSVSTMDWFYGLTEAQQSALMESITPLGSSNAQGDEQFYQGFHDSGNNAGSEEEGGHDDGDAPEGEGQGWNTVIPEEEDTDDPPPITTRDVVPAYQTQLEKRKRSQAVRSTVDDEESVHGSQPSSPLPSEGLPVSKKKRTQKSRSISAIPVDHQPIVEAAFNHLKICMTNTMPFPLAGKRKSSRRLQTSEFDILLLTSWENACHQLKVGDVDPTDSDLKLIRSRVSQFRSDVKMVARTLVPEAFKFQDVKNLTNPTPERVAAVLAANRQIVADVKKTFHYTDPSNTKIPNSMFRHPILQGVLNGAWFGIKENDRTSYFTGKTMLELVTLALICVAILNAIDEWSTGQQKTIAFEHKTYYPHYQALLRNLERWRAFSDGAARDHHTRDLATETREAMLRDARAVSAVFEMEEEHQEEEEDMFSDAALAANHAI